MVFATRQHGPASTSPSPTTSPTPTAAQALLLCRPVPDRNRTAADWLGPMGGGHNRGRAKPTHFMALQSRNFLVTPHSAQSQRCFSLPGGSGHWPFKLGLPPHPPMADCNPFPDRNSDRDNDHDRDHDGHRNRQPISQGNTHPHPIGRDGGRRGLNGLGEVFWAELWTCAFPTSMFVRISSGMLFAFDLFSTFQTEYFHIPSENMF